MTGRAPDPLEVGRTVSLRAVRWEGEKPLVGHYLGTAKGVWAYLVVAIRVNARPDPASWASLRCVKVLRADVPEGARVHGWAWSSRG